MLQRRLAPMLLLASLPPLATAPWAWANDSTAMLEAGGIRLVETRSISLDKEELYISPTDIRIHYEFFNHSEQDQQMLVAFSRPEIEAEPEYNYGISNTDPVNFLGFTVRSNGEPVKPKLEIKLTMNGIDFTSDLLENGVPLHRFSDDYYGRIENLSDEAKHALLAKGLINWAPGDDYYTKNWQVKATYYWSQTFPAGVRTVLEHSYQPVLGGGIISEQYGINDNIDRFCIDEDFHRAFMRKVAKTGHEEMLSNEVRYILKTANNWLGPIGDFRLVIDKLEPDNLVSLCIHGIRKIAPTQFEFRAQNFIPQQDLDILVVMPPDWDTN